MNFSIYNLALSQVLRFLLRAVAVILGYVGVTTEVQSELVEVTIFIVTPILLALLAEGYSYIQSRYIPPIINEALKSAPETPVSLVIERGKQKVNHPNYKSLSLLIVFSLVLTACPARSDLVKAFKASEQLAVTTETAALAIGDLYQGKVISFEQKEKLISKMRIIATNGRRFHTEVSALAAIYKTKLPDEKISALDVLFNSEVIAPFLEVLLEAGALSKEASQRVFLVLAVLRTAVLTISNAFGKRLSDSRSYQFYKENSAYA